VFLTAVSHVYLDFGTSRQRPAVELTTSEAERHLREGQFGEGSMAPKVAASISFLAQGGRRCYITSSRWLTAAVAGSHGTRIVAHPAASERPASGQ
jgi:carbamate kinase